MSHSFPQVTGFYSGEVERLRIPIKDLEALVERVVAVYFDMSVRATRIYFEKRPEKTGVLFKDEFWNRRDKHRADFLVKYGYTPRPNSSKEDYTPVTFLNEVWGEFVDAKVISGRFLEKVDKKLYRALVDHVRGSKEGRSGRVPTTLTEIGVYSERQVRAAAGLPHIVIRPSRKRQSE